ncbi:Transcription factor CBF/NF-Y/archaeal histone domain-containing protein [Plasmodiophora brassicae]|uniref:Transcription factor CBF/NF-Y/archaeal histone domain-containing protein n=1 Tax=Plasmodiophora brassicae TaxID=37360 RepID=A0A3P3YH47_PLABS|nr:unnamed protein product [Plasmodiophora brassicae]
MPPEDVLNDAVEIVVGPGPEPLLPLPTIGRNIRSCLPPHAKVACGVKDGVREYVTEFLGFLTSECSDRMRRQNRKTITAQDVLLSVEAVGFAGFVPDLRRHDNETRLKRAHDLRKARASSCT